MPQFDFSLAIFFGYVIGVNLGCHLYKFELLRGVLDLVNPIRAILLVGKLANSPNSAPTGLTVLIWLLGAILFLAFIVLAYW